MEGRRGRRLYPRAAAAACLLAALGAPGLRAAEADPPLAAILDRVGKQVEEFWNYIPGVTCTETMSQVRLDAKGKALYQRTTTSDYLILLQRSGAELSVDESRMETGRKGSKGKASLLTTDGFSILLLALHPVYQSSYEFRRLDDDVEEGRRTLRISFQQLPGMRSPSALRLGNLEYPLAWKGTAWIAPADFDVVRMKADLGSSMADTGLAQLTADVAYEGIQFAGAASTYWLPSRAVIEAATRRQRWRNTHVFSNYRRFNVETEVRTAATPQ